MKNVIVYTYNINKHENTYKMRFIFRDFMRNGNCALVLFLFIGHFYNSVKTIFSINLDKRYFPRWQIVSSLFFIQHVTFFIFPMVFL